MLRLAQAGRRTGLLAAVVGICGALMLSPASLAARDHGNSGGRNEAPTKWGAAPQANEKKKKDAQRETHQAMPKAGNADRHPVEAHHNEGDARPAAPGHRNEQADRRPDGPAPRREDSGRRPQDFGKAYGVPVCNCPSPSGAGVLRVNGCAVQIGDDHKFKKIAKAFKRAGYEAFVKTVGGVTIVRVYGFPSFDWDAGKFQTHTFRQGSVLDISLCKIGG